MATRDSCITHQYQNAGWECHCVVAPHLVQLMADQATYSQIWHSQVQHLLPQYSQYGISSTGSHFPQAMRVTNHIQFKHLCTLIFQKRVCTCHSLQDKQKPWNKCSPRYVSRVYRLCDSSMIHGSTGISNTVRWFMPHARLTVVSWLTRHDTLPDTGSFNTIGFRAIQGCYRRRFQIVNQGSSVSQMKRQL